MTGPGLFYLAGVAFLMVAGATSQIPGTVPGDVLAFAGLAVVCWLTGLLQGRPR